MPPEEKHCTEPRALPSRFPSASLTQSKRLFLGVLFPCLIGRTAVSGIHGECFDSPLRCPSFSTLIWNLEAGTLGVSPFFLSSMSALFVATGDLFMTGDVRSLARLSHLFHTCHVQIVNSSTDWQFIHGDIRVTNEISRTRPCYEEIGLKCSLLHELSDQTPVSVRVQNPRIRTVLKKCSQDHSNGSEIISRGCRQPLHLVSR